MAKKKAHEYAAEVLSTDDYLKKILDKIDDGEKETVLSRLGERIMAKDDYSRGHDELRKKDEAIVAYKGTLDSWYADKLDLIQKGSTALTELEKLKAAGTSTPSGEASASMKALEGFVKKEDVDKIVAATVQKSEETGLAVMTQLGTLIGQHHHTYGEPLDTAALISFARSKGSSLMDAYSEMTAERRQKLAEDTAKKEREKLKAEVRAELQKEQGHGVYPIADGETLSPTLSGLAAQNKKGTNGAEEFGVKAALDEYYKMNRS
jgi:hypothetical protein